MDTTVKKDDYLDTLYNSSDYPSDAEAETVKAEFTEKHRRTKKKLDERLKSQNREDVKSQLEVEKKRLSSSLAGSTVDEPAISPEKKRQERRARRAKTENADETSLDKAKVKRKSRRKKSEDTPGKIETEEIQAASSQMQSEELVSRPPKHIDRAAIAAAVREKRKRDKEAEMQESMKDDDLNMTRQSLDRQISTRFDVEAMNTARLSLAPEPDIPWETLKQQEMITEKQSFDFFCRQWPVVPKQEKRKSLPTEGDIENTERRESQELKDTSKLIDNPDQSANYTIFKHSTLFLQTLPATKLPSYEILLKEEESGMLFYPGTVDMSYFNNRRLRNLEDEGLYVGRRPFINTTNERRLASRIQKENKMEWFGEDGRIKILPDPLKEIPFRPLMWNEQFNPMPDGLHTEDLKPIISSTTYEQIDSGDPNSSFQMIINIESLEFSHHHLFSYEHVLAQRIKQLFIAYQYINKQEGLDFFQQRILSLKHAIQHLQEKLSNKAVAAQSEILARIDNYRQEIRNTRNARNNEEGYLRKLKTSIIKTWKQIKAERNNTGMTLTDVSVKIKKQLADADEDYRLWEKDIADQIAEEKEYFENNYRKEMKIYENQKQLFEKQSKLKTEARQRQEEKEQKEENLKSGNRRNKRKEEVDYFQEAEDIKVLGEPDIGEPVMPKPFDEESLSREIRCQFELSRRLPGEPFIHPVLKVGPISNENLTKEELNRRNTMQKYQYNVELFFNNKKVVVTSNKELNHDFSVTFNEKIPVIISQYPEVIILKLYESSGFSSKFLSNLEMDVPLPFKLSENEEMETYSFKTNQILVHRNCGVGSGEKSFPLESLDGTPSGEIISPLFTCGFIFARTVWAVNSDGELMIPLSYLNSEKFKNFKHNRDPLLAMGLTKILDLQRRQEWESIESHLDPNDPRDAKVITALHTNEELGIDSETKLSSDFFRLNPYMDEFAFSTEDDIDRSLRYRMIRLRNNNVPEFLTLPIPLYDDKVPLELIKDYENRKGVNKNKVIVSGFEARKLIHQEFIEKVRDEVLSKFRTSLMKKSLVEMVREEEIPTINDIFPKLFNVNRFSRPLQRLPEPRKPISVHNIYEMDVEIVVVIQRATNLPMDVERRTLTPFVQVNFQNINRTTDVLEGINPAWDIELRLPFKPPTTVTSLDTIRDTVLINVYDQQVINLNNDVNSKFHTLHERYERHWLGSLEIPFNTIYLNSKIEGNFRLKQPAFVQGYDTVEYVESFPMLSVFITLDPEIHPPQSLKDRFDSIEDRDLISHIDRWQNEMNMRFPKRFRRVTVVNMRCQETLITRYISSLKPPEELLSVDENIKLKIVARFVSLISFMADAIVFPGISDIWSTCDQFLKMLIGDEDEHAVLLCNYFNYLYQDPNRVYLCLGEAIPEGSTAYVLTKETNGDVWLWNASTGMKFKSNDSTCSMFKIGLLVNERNVWANTQQRVQPWELRYDFSIKADWFPLFKSDINLQTVQPEAIIYEEPFLKEVQDFQLTLENQLRSNIMDWRLGLPTNFLIAPRREMVEILKGLEANCGEIDEVIREKVKNLMTGYKVFGFPINLPYMEIPDVLSRVEATGIHLTADPRVEFALAVYIKSYSNTVLSIWIYVASLVRNNK